MRGASWRADRSTKCWRTRGTLTRAACSRASPISTTRASDSRPFPEMCRTRFPRYPAAGFIHAACARPSNANRPFRASRRSTRRAAGRSPASIHITIFRRGSSEMADPGPLVEVRGLKKNFPGVANAWGKSKGVVQAVADVSFDIYRGETLALVGESGCGKSTLGRLLLRLIESTSGTISFDGRDLTSLAGETLRRARPDFQLIFQDSGSAFNPRMRIFNIVEE